MCIRTSPKYKKDICCTEHLVLVSALSGFHASWWDSSGKMVAMTQSANMSEDFPFPSTYLGISSEFGVVQCMAKLLVDLILQMKGSAIITK